MQRDKERWGKKRIMVCIKAKYFHITVIRTSGAFVLYTKASCENSPQSLTKPPGAALSDISNGSPLLPIPLLFLDELIG